MGASVSVRSSGRMTKLKAVDVIVGDASPPSSIAKDARDRDMFIVSTEWVVQCLIDGTKVPLGDYVI